jgi:hypothetical protein
MPVPAFVRLVLDVGLSPHQPLGIEPGTVPLTGGRPAAPHTVHVVVVLGADGKVVRSAARRVIAVVPHNVTGRYDLTWMTQ